MDFYGSELPVFRANLHTHSTTSDGMSTPQQAIWQYQQAGYDVLAFTDHRKTNPVSSFDGRGMTLISGIELHPRGPRNTRYWHLLALGVPEDFPGEFDSAQTAIDAVNAAGGIVFVAHPHWCGQTSADILALHGYAGIEVYNTGCRNIGKADSEQCWDELIQQGRPCGALAVDDMHRPYDLFGGWTMIAAPDKSPEAILHALRAGSYYATQGPQFTRLELKGRVFTAEFSEVVSAVLIGEGYTGWVGVLPDHPMRGMHESATSMRVLIQPEYSGSVRCRIVDAAGRRAWSTPVKVE